MALSNFYPHAMNRITRVFLLATAAIVLSALVPWVASGSQGIATAADAPVEPAPAAVSVDDGGFVLLAEDQQEATVSVGSTEGFPAAPPGQLGDWHSGAMDPNDPGWYSGTSGATGMWGIQGLVGTSLTIDSCGSSFSAQLAVYSAYDFRDHVTSELAYTADACAEPITMPYSKLPTANGGPAGLVRIDDATGEGGDYQVNYRRTPPETTPPRVRASMPVVKHLRRPKGARRIGMASSASTIARWTQTAPIR